jgi:hypothetical protein
MNKIKQQGSALIELALVIPIVMTLCIGGIILAYQLRTQVYAVSIASIASQLLYRDCRFEAPPDRPDCMNTLKTNIEAAQSVTGFSTFVTLSEYEDIGIYTGTSPYISPVLIHKTAEPVVINGLSYSSKYSTLVLTNPGKPYLYEHYRLNGMVWIVEVYVKNPFSFAGIGGGVGYEVSLS